MENTIQKRIETRESTVFEIKDTLISVLNINLQLIDIDPDTPLFGTGLGLDSVDAVVIIVELETRFNISISEEEGMMALRTINSVSDLIISKKHDNA